MERNLKYQLLIDNQSLTVPCPDLLTTEVEKEKDSFRWCCDPISDAMFLPSLLEDEAKNKPPRELHGDSKHCGACALSLFDTLAQAKKHFIKFPLPTRQKLGYTHVANGKLSCLDGKVSSSDKNGHFLFFEYTQADLSSKFSIIDQF